MSKRINISSGAHWEDIVGYSRAVRVGNVIEVAGTAAADGDKVMFPYQAYEQTQYILLKIQQAIEDAGGTMEDVVRTRIFVTDIDGHWEDIGKAHGEFFKDIKPVTSMVEVMALINREMVVEIEATAIISSA